jgi:hypothetical protein
MPTTMPTLLDIQQLRLLEEPDDAPAEPLAGDILIVGGGLGGVAAALAACGRGRRVILAEETDWIGGQLTAQGVSAPDEHQYIESFGGTRRYYELRRRIRDHYRARYILSPAAEAAAALNPGGGWVSRLCCEPAVARGVLEAMLQPHLDSGQLTLLRRYKAVRAEVDGDTIRAVVLRDLDGDRRFYVEARYFLDATEVGDLLPLTGTEYVSGAEAQLDTGEPHARPDEAAPECVQSFTYPFAVEFRPGESHVIPKPEGYEENRDRQPYTFAHVYHDERGTLTYRMFEHGEGNVPPFWTYRRLVSAGNFADPRCPHDVAMINWPGNDFRSGSLIDRTPEAVLETLRQAKLLSLGFCYWLQTEAPRDDGGKGYPELLLRPDVMGTAAGLSKHPYIRESRRILAQRVVQEQAIAATDQPGERAAFMLDSVGIGWYVIDIHPGEFEEKIPPEKTLPFQIPLAALLPIRVTNLLPACKNLGTTHITNGAYRLHPVEWNIGEAAGALAAFCLEREVSPSTVGIDPAFLRIFQASLVEDGIPLDWHIDVPLDHAAFAATQLLSAWALWPADPDRLEFRPDELIPRTEAAQLVEQLDPPAAPKTLAALSEHPTRAEFAIAWLTAVRNLRG